MAGMIKHNTTLTDEENQRIEMFDTENGHLYFDIFSHDNPYSVINTVPKILKQFIDQIPTELREMTTEELREVVKPDKTLNQLRLKFWKEYDYCIGARKKMSVLKMSAGTCSVPILKKIMANREKAAWIVTPISAYNLGVEELMETVLHKLREKVDTVDINSSKDLSVLLKIYETFDKRVHGEYKREDTLKIENKASQFQDSSEIKRYIEQNNLKIE